MGKFSPANNITHMNDIEHYRINKTYLSISWPGGVITVLPVPETIPAAGGRCTIALVFTRMLGWLIDVIGVWKSGQENFTIIVNDWSQILFSLYLYC